MKYGYARVSTEEQNLDMQIDALRKEECERIFAEKITGVAKIKPEFERMMGELRSGDVVVVYAFSRISRSLRDLINIVEVFKAKGVEVKSITEPIDTTTDMGDAFYKMAGIFAELERKILINRVKSGVSIARARGKMGGRKPKLNDKQVKLLKELHADKSIPIKELQDMFKISRSALYVYLNK